MPRQNRSAWTSSAARSVPVKQRQRHITWHHPGWGTNSVQPSTWAHSRCLSQIKTWEAQHRARGSKDIEYNWFVCPHAYWIEGRGWLQSGANGTSAANRAGQSVQFLKGDNDALTPGHLQGAGELITYLESKAPGISRTQYGHRHWVSTTCPGATVMAAIPFRARGSLPGISGGGATVPRPSIPASTPASPAFADVDKTQRWLTELGYDPGPIDGKYGSKTETATRQAQHNLGITPADGRPGPATRQALGEAVSKLDDLDKKLDRLIAFGEQNQWRLDKLRGDAAANRWRLDKVPDAIVKAVQETSKAQGLTDDQVQAIASAAAEAATRVSAEDIAGQLAVTVAKGDG